MANNERQGDIKDYGLFNFIGSYGPWQRRVFILFFIVNIFGIWQNFAVTFLAPNMDYWCVSPRPLYSNTSAEEARNHTDQCNVWIANASSENHGSTTPCVEWEYDTSDYSRTIVNEWDLVCDREWLVSFAKSIYMLGFMLSVLIFGQLSDIIGRYPTVMICLLITCTSSMLLPFSASYLMFIILRFFAAFGRTGMTTTGFVMLMEIVGSEWRTCFGVAIQFGWSIGFLTLPIVAYFLRTWYWLQLAIGIPTIPIVCAYWLVPESPRWLMAQGKAEKFIKVVSDAAKHNGKELDMCELKSFISKHFGKEEEIKPKTFFDLVRTPIIARRTFYMAVLWLVNSFVYYALSYNTNDLGGNPYINFFISGLMEFLAYFAVYFGITKLGRKISLIFGMMVGGAACAGIMAVPPDILWLVITFSMIGKFCISATFGLLYIYTTEMFPTVVRNISIGTCSTCARIGSITAPFVRELDRKTHYTVPFAINAGLAILSSLLVFLLPETKNRKIPDTMEEVADVDEWALKEKHTGTKLQKH